MSNSPKFSVSYAEVAGKTLPISPPSQVVHAVNQTQVKIPQKTQPEPTNFNYRTLTMVTRATVHQPTQIQTFNAKSTNIPEPRDPDNITDNAASDSSNMSIDGTKVDQARKKTDECGWQRIRPKK
ncbi:hypothetical protein CBL_20808 [Carabus blaptoides fortunei]